MANHITRRQALGTTAALLGAPAMVRQANAQSRFDWKRFAGERIEVTLQTSPRGLLLQRNNKEFEDLTGIRCGIEVVPEQQHRQKIIVEYASGRPSFDVAELSLHVNKRQVGKARWNTDIKALIADASITAPDFDFADFGAGMVQYATQADGRMDSLPAFADYFILYYNKELLAAKNIAVPTTWDGMFEAARALTEPSRQIYGHVGRGLKNANVVLWSSYLLGTAQRDMINANRQLITDTDDAVWAGEMYKKFLRDVSPPGSIGFNWNECQTTFMQGRAAMWIDGIGFGRSATFARGGQGWLCVGAEGARAQSPLLPVWRGLWHPRSVPQEGGGLALFAMGAWQGKPATLPDQRCRRAGA
jgi:multiple sugar transport system substrate-binding protein